MVFPLFLRVGVLPLCAITKGGAVFHVHSNLPIRVVHSQRHVVALKQVCQVLVSEFQIQADLDATVMFCTSSTPRIYHREGYSWNSIDAVEAVH